MFVNYRTGDGEKTAAVIDRELSHRFGEDKVFRASKSIKPGSPYPAELLANVRNCSALVAVIGPDWAGAPALRNENDWVRREIVEALAYGIPVIPVLDGRRTERLRSSELPPELGWLADYQSIRLDLQDAESGLTRIAKALVELVPTLRDHTTAEGPDTVHNQMRDVQGTGVQGRNIHGDVGTVMKGNQGSIHMGKGNQYNNSSHFSGPGAAYVQGSNEGGISHTFGGSDKNEDER
ncbi:toll/interleukin-1 receptor domain-containing protein [Sphaerisporangium rufum]|uniref:toll/interleukin-1 receptor domain-containing protein n=1 Tax=Sphaerisporangium rufum TaxID=1381558 RepID=UPI001950B96F|nr:toll/interleukin-1 receptor domain-containing protein [Sphaerisporangium rufum]